MVSFFVHTASASFIVVVYCCVFMLYAVVCVYVFVYFSYYEVHTSFVYRGRPVTRGPLTALSPARPSSLVLHSLPYLAIHPQVSLCNAIHHGPPGCVLTSETRASNGGVCRCLCRCLSRNGFEPSRCTSSTGLRGARSSGNKIGWGLSQPIAGFLFIG